MGFIEETGAAQLLRDARIAPIYEGTNGIQAIDLVTRKLPLAGGAHVQGYLGELGVTAERVATSNREEFGDTAKLLRTAIEDLASATTFLQQAQTEGRFEDALAGATPYLRLFALAAGGAYLASGALADDKPDRTALCRFFAENMIGECAALRNRVTDGSASLAAAASTLLPA